MSEAKNSDVDKKTGGMEANAKIDPKMESREEKEMKADESIGLTKSPIKSPVKSTAKSPAKTPAKSTAKSPAKTPAKSTAKSPAKTPAKSSTPKKTPQKRKADPNENGDEVTKEEEKEDEEDEEDEEESSDEELVGLLDGPVRLMEGKRERKKTERLTFDTKKEVTDVKFEVEDGTGIKLGEIPNIEFYIAKTNSDYFRALYRFFFGKTGKQNEIKRNIRKFSGFNFEKGTPEYNKKESILVRYTMPGLKEICMWLDLDKKGTKDEIMERILTFCLKPEPSGKPHPQQKKKSKPVKKKGKKRKRQEDGSGDAKKAKKAKKPKKKSAEEVGEGDEADDEDDMSAADEDDKEEEEENEVAEEEEEPKKKKAKLDKPTPKKKVEKKKSEKKSTPKSPKKSPTKSPTKKVASKKATPKKTTPKKAAIQITPKSVPKSKPKKLSIEDSDDSSDDEPLIRKAEPSEAQIENTIQGFLDKANLELVTMKMVCKKVYETYPDFNLTHKKDFIKAKVRSIIS